MTEKNQSQQVSSDIQALREILFQEESVRIDKIETLLNDKNLHAKAIAEVLAEAVRLRSKEGNQLGEALQPAVESAITASIAKNPKPLSDALFPVMGPSIRKAINHAISGMLQSLNQTLEHSFSAKGLQWRLESIRTGKSFAEIVMLNTLVYRVEQVFLIHKETGLLLKHLSSNPADNEDADVVSSMLTAVRDFIQDSFTAASDQEAQSLRLGDLEIIVEQGPDTVLAVVCRGNVPRSLYTSMSVALEDIQHEFHAALQNFDGDTSHFDPVETLLSTLMISDYGKKQEEGDGEEESSSQKPLIVIVGVLSIALLWWGWHAYQNHINATHWQHYIETLRHEPGIVLTHVSEKDGLHTLTGLRDPLSKDPASLLKSFELNQDHVQYQFQSYHALDHDIVLTRAIQHIQPPQGIHLALKGNTLYISGRASKAWADNVKKQALWVAGIEAVDTHQLIQPTPLIERIRKAIQPPNDVHLQLDNSILTLTGKATEAWVNHAKTSIQSIPEIAAYHDEQVIRTDSPEYLLSLAKKALHAPKGIVLRMGSDKILMVQGKATQTWLNHAKTSIQSIPEIAAYHDEQVIRTDSPEYLLSLAKKALHAPKSVALQMGNNKILVAQGHASKQWMDQAKRIVEHISGIQGFDSSALKLSDNVILARAIKALQPPASVNLFFAQGTLTAEGTAPEAWIKHAQDNALLVQGVRSFSTENLHPETSPWQKLNIEVQSIHLVSTNKKPALTPHDKTILKKLADIYQKSLKLNPTTRLQILAFHDADTKFVARIRLNKIIGILNTYGILEAQIDSKLMPQGNKAMTFSLLKTKGATH